MDAFKDVTALAGTAGLPDVQAISCNYLEEAEASEERVRLLSSNPELLAYEEDKADYERLRTSQYSYAGYDLPNRPGYGYQGGQASRERTGYQNYQSGYGDASARPTNFATANYGAGAMDRESSPMPFATAGGPAGSLSL